MRYTNKFVEFLNGANTIKISGVRDFNSLKSLCNRIGLDIGYATYWDLLALAQNNACAINNTTVLIEYQPYKGFTIGYRTYEESGKWYGKDPWTMDEVRTSLNDAMEATK